MATGRRLTAEEYLRQAPEDRTSELVRGEVIAMNPPGWRHGRLTARISYLLTAFAEPRGLGEVLNDFGLVTERDPDTVRSPDVAFFPFGSNPDEFDEPGYGARPPLLVFEVRSPGDRTPALLEKVSEYLLAGVQVVVSLEPEQRTATVFTLESSGRSYGADDVLPLPAPLDELKLSVAEWLHRPQPPRPSA